MVSFGVRPVAQRVGDLVMVGVDGEPEISPPQPEAQPVDPVRQVRIEREDPLVVAQAAETRDQSGPCPGQRRHVQAVSVLL